MKKKKNKVYVLDTIIGDIFSLIPNGLVGFMTNKEVEKALNTVIKTSIERRLDTLFELKDGSILHVEVQSYNDKKMAVVV